MARALGFFDDLSVDVNFHVFDAGRDINLAIASGSIDFGMPGASPAAVAITSEIGVDVYLIHGKVCKTLRGKFGKVIKARLYL